MVLANERMNKGLTQRKMAEMLNLPYSTYCEYEKGKKSVPADIAEQIASILHKPVSAIFLPVRFAVCELDKGKKLNKDVGK